MRGVFCNILYNRYIRYLFYCFLIHLTSFYLHFHEKSSKNARWVGFFFISLINRLISRDEGIK